MVPDHRAGSDGVFFSAVWLGGVSLPPAAPVCSRVGCSEFPIFETIRARARHVHADRFGFLNPFMRPREGRPSGRLVSRRSYAGVNRHL